MGAKFRICFLFKNIQAMKNSYSSDTHVQLIQRQKPNQNLTLKLINHEGEGDSDHQADKGILTMPYSQDHVKKRTGQTW